MPLHDYYGGGYGDYDYHASEVTGVTMHYVGYAYSSKPKSAKKKKKASGKKSKAASVSGSRTTKGFVPASTLGYYGADKVRHPKKPREDNDGARSGMDTSWDGYRVREERAPWTPSEISRLRECEGVFDETDWKVVLPNRSLEDIVSKAQEYGIDTGISQAKQAHAPAHKRTAWTSSEDLRLESAGDDWNPSDFPGRTEEEIAARLKFLAFRKNAKHS